LCSFDIHQYKNIHDPTNKGMNDMTNVMGRQQADEDIFAFEVSDEAMEIAAGTENEKASYTLGACTGLSVCPG
jgi:proteasome assembly chaperone (PAC2) family protein